MAMRDSNYADRQLYPKRSSNINEAPVPVAQPPISAASDRLNEALFQLHERLETLTAKLTPVLHAQPPQPTKVSEEPLASDVGLVRQLDDATGRVLQAVHAVDDLIDRAAV